MQLTRAVSVLAAGMLVSCGNDDGPAPLSGTVEAWASSYEYVIVPGSAPLLTRVELYNGTNESIVLPHCATDAGYPMEGDPYIAVGFKILKEAPDGSWQVWEEAGIPPCDLAPPELDQLLYSGLHGGGQLLRVPPEGGRYSWVVAYYPSESIRTLTYVATAPVTVLTR